MSLIDLVYGCIKMNGNHVFYHAVFYPVNELCVRLPIGACYNEVFAQRSLTPDK